MPLRLDIKRQLSSRLEARYPCREYGRCLVVLACKSTSFVLRHNKVVVAQSFAAGTNLPDEGVDGAFCLLHKISEKVGTGTWIGECLLYTNAGGRFNYYVGDSGIFDGQNENVVSYTVSLVMLEYQTAVVRRDFESANDILRKIPAAQMDLVARFLEAQDFKEEALTLSTDPDQNFDFAA
ncbi:unnamed protein product [Peronospora belbahrii]|uniref:COPA/B TPR domain-containing protein n=1 Tax=Peronospora belbahrii TaxID=622444 RepID=A0AAU9KQ00_9STRA|nr:unnamed protein product [Peronospora belbahrii]